MAVIQQTFSHRFGVPSGTATTSFYLCDTEAERPVGNEGDTAYTKDTDRFWKYTTSWVELAAGSSTTNNTFVTNLLGPPALDGEDGIEAFPIPGPRGSDGVPGANGIIGRDGSPGLDGEAEYIEPIVIPGPKGDTGNTGSAGNQGIQGIQGLQGIPGIDAEEPIYEIPIPGSKGIDGTIGSNGAPGSIGPPGLDADFEYIEPLVIPGPKGDSGSSGSPGAPGSQGLQGVPGPIGLDAEEPNEPLMIPGPKGDAGSAGSSITAGTYLLSSFTVATGNWRVQVKELQMTSSNRATLQGTARLSIIN